MERVRDRSATPVTQYDEEALRPTTPFKLSLVQLIALMMVLGGVGYTVGLVHAQLDQHKASVGHPETIKRLRVAELTLERVTVVLEHVTDVSAGGRRSRGRRTDIAPYSPD